MAIDDMFDCQMKALLISVLDSTLGYQHLTIYINPSSDLRIFFFYPHEVHKIDHKYVGLVIGKVGGGFFLLHRTFSKLSMMESDGLSKNWRWTPKKLENDSWEWQFKLRTGYIQCIPMPDCVDFAQDGSTIKSFKKQLGAQCLGKPNCLPKIERRMGLPGLGKVESRTKATSQSGCLKLWLSQEWPSFVCPSIGWGEKFAGMTTPVSKIFPEDNPLTTSKFRNIHNISMVDFGYDAQILCSQGATCTATYCDCRV